MAQIFRKIIASAALACLSVGAQATVLTFEDVPLATGAHFFVADYHGFTFGTNSSLTTQWFYTDEISVNYLPQSPSHYIATTPVSGPPTGALFEAAQSITSATDFVFDGAWFTGLGDNIRYKLYNNGVLMHTSTDSLTFNDTAPIFANSGYTGLVDEVVILGRIGFYALDDFTYNEGTGIPEPTSLALVLLAGAAGVGATRRRAAGTGSATAA